MQSRLPEYRNLIQLADRHATIEAGWPVSKMPRLLGMLSATTGDATAEMQFGKSGSLRYITGRVQATVEMTCQRCLQPMPLQLESEFKLALVASEAEAQLIPEEYEPLITEGEHYLPDIIEDELILAAPIVSSHAESCSDYLMQQASEQVSAEDAEQERKNPFAVLKDLL